MQLQAAVMSIINWKYYITGTAILAHLPVQPGCRQKREELRKESLADGKDTGSSNHK